MSGGLTQTQATLLAFIRRYIGENGGVSPSIDDMRAEMCLDSKSSVHRILKELRARGAIDWTAHGRRTVRVLGEYRDPYDPTTLAAQSTATLEHLAGAITEILYRRSIAAVAAHPTAPALEGRA